MCRWVCFTVLFPVFGFSGGCEIILKFTSIEQEAGCRYYGVGKTIATFLPLGSVEANFSSNTLGDAYDFKSSALGGTFAVEAKTSAQFLNHGDSISGSTNHKVDCPVVKLIGFTEAFTSANCPPPMPNPTAGQNCSCCPNCSPILIDLSDNGFLFGPEGKGVNFDLLGNGSPLFLQWTKAGEDDSFLIVDLNSNDIVDDGSELFGNGTRLLLEGNALAPNGFVGLAQYDHPDLGGNDDGFITRDDGIWEVLFLWNDIDADGVFESNELYPLEELGLTRLGTIPQEKKLSDGKGNFLRFWSWSYNDDLRPNDKFEMVDVFFKVLGPNR